MAKRRKKSSKRRRPAPDSATSSPKGADKVRPPANAKPKEPGAGGKGKLKSPELAHDDREIDIRSIGMFTIVLLILVGAAMALMWWMTAELQQVEVSGHTSPPPLRPTSNLPREPKLQRVPRLGLKTMRQQHQRQLNSYGWNNRAQGTVRIPIERAMDLLVQRGLPARPEAPAGQRMAVPNESGFGIVAPADDAHAGDRKPDAGRTGAD